MAVFAVYEAGQLRERKGRPQSKPIVCYIACSLYIAVDCSFGACWLSGANAHIHIVAD